MDFIPSARVKKEIEQKEKLEADEDEKELKSDPDKDLSSGLSILLRLFCQKLCYSNDCRWRTICNL
jgi:hypothetical protein